VATGPIAGAGPDALHGSPTPGTRARALVTDVGLVGVGLLAYVVVRAVTHGDTEVALAHAHDVLALEAALGLDVELAVQQWALDTAPWLVTAATWFYVWGYFPVLVPTTLWLRARRPEAYRRLRTALLASGVVGLAVYALYPCAPPWLTDPGFVDTVSGASLEGVARPGALMNDLGAMPSFHLGWVTLVAVVLAGATTSVGVRVWCVVHPVAMAVAVVLTGNHWILDLPAGLALTAVGLLAADRWPTARHPRPGPATG
jgi:PAP2 superfamily